MSEFLYVLENPSMPGILKIGMTSREVAERVSELSSHTGVPTEFVVVKEYEVADAVEAEKIVHSRLADCRVSAGREFFKIEVEDAIQIIDALLESAKETRPRDFDWEDELIASAIPIAAKLGTVRPRILEGMLGVSYEDAVFVVEALRARGMLNERNECIGLRKVNPEPRKTPNITGLAPLPRLRLPVKRARPITVATTPIIGNYQLPALDLLHHPDLTVKHTETKEELVANSRLIVRTLAQLGIEVAPGDITRGPTITRYELHLAPGVNPEEVTERASELAAALRAERLNVLASIPGKSSVGVELPNSVRMKVIFRDLLESPEWCSSKARIPLALGKDVCGHPIIADLAEMPHVLIAGSTGSGKSVCINTIIASLLFRFGPDQLRFVMIDPKAVELQQYNALPHLVVPAVTDSTKAILALRWVVNEMEKRYQIFAKVGVGNLKSFNNRSKDKPPRPVASELPLTSYKEQVEPGAEGFAVEVDEQIVVPRYDDIIIPEKLSYIVVVIDELADLLSASTGDVEMAVARIAQLGRAAGIHLVMATREPLANPLPEATKASITARVAFRCGSRRESRAILGEAGAEKLLGKGDAFYLSAGSTKPIRFQGTFITDQEVEGVVAHIARQGRPSYDVGIHEALSSIGSTPLDPDGEGGLNDTDEALVVMALDVIRSEQRVSTSLLQRRLKIDYGHAARLLDELEDRGIVGPSKGTEPRDILVDLDDQSHDAREQQARQNGEPDLKGPIPPTDSESRNPWWKFW